MSRIKVGDTVMMNNNAKGLGEVIYALGGVIMGDKYEVTNVVLDKNVEYGGEIHLEGHDDMPYVAEDFDVVVRW